MFCCPAGNEKDRKVAKEIDQDIRKDRELIQSRQIKLLLLGTGDSGKSTFAKQMRILHKDGGFKKREIENYRIITRESVVIAMQTLIKATREKLKLTISSSLSADVQLVLEATEMSESLIGPIQNIWSDPAIKKAWSKANEFQIDQCADYMLDNVARIGKNDYAPTTEDILRVRQKTTGIVEIKFELEELDFTLVDVGGQRSERRKWLHCFEDVTAIIYFVALNEYDMKLIEDERVNRMKESLELFQEISSSKWFKKTSFIVFLNKSDLFKEKIKKSPLKKLFSDYTGESDYDKALQHIKEKFKETFRGELMYTYVTCALSTENVKKVFASVKDIIITQVNGSL